ncbi:MAG: PKD domain-containing protein [Bacteroidota bacterium]
MKRALAYSLAIIVSNWLSSCDSEEGEQLESVVAEFSAGNTQLDQGFMVSFTDLSLGTPDTWNWSFEGGSPSTSNEQNPTITYESAGTFEVTLSASNSISSDVITKSGYITVNPSFPDGSGLFNLTLTHDDLVREYLMYVPEVYTGSAAVPLLIDLHGNLGTREQQYNSSEFYKVADVENFILITPESLIPERFTQWNYDNLPDAADDVGFISTLMDAVIANYNIDEKRIYVAGSSGGAVMAFNLACQLSTRIAAVAGVKGIMNQAVFNGCNPEKPMPILQLHGTEDPIIPYDPAVPTTLGYWVQYNETSQDPIITPVSDEFPDNGNTADYILLDNGTNGVTVEHFRVNGGGHDWFKKPNHDVDATEEAWKFFSKYDLNGRVLR